MTISPKRASKLNQKKHREVERLFLAEGASLIDESPERPLHLFETVEDVRRISALTTPTGPVGIFPFLDVSPEALIAGSERILLLHGVQDPGNVGTMIRAAHAFDAGVALSKGCADLYNPKTVRATMGSIFHAPITRELESPGFIEIAREAGFDSFAALPGGGSDPKTMPDGRLLIAVGSEGSGLPDDVRTACDGRVTIPSRAGSLNAAVAASILLYEAYTRVLP